MAAADLILPIDDVVADGYAEVALELPADRADWSGLILSARSSDNAVVPPSDIRFGGGHAWRSLMITPQPAANGTTEIIEVSSFLRCLRKRLVCPLNHVCPIAHFGLANEVHARVPRRGISLLQPSPIGNFSQ